MSICPRVVNKGKGARPTMLAPNTEISTAIKKLMVSPLNTIAPMAFFYDSFLWLDIWKQHGRLTMENLLGFHYLKDPFPSESTTTVGTRFFQYEEGRSKLFQIFSSLLDTEKHKKTTLFRVAGDSRQVHHRNRSASSCGFFVHPILPVPDPIPI